MSITPFKAKISATTMLSPDVKHFTAKVLTDPIFSFIPGQFISIHFEHDNKTLKRSYSIACAPNQVNQIEFSASYVPNGPGSEYLFRLKPEDIINCTGPFGRLILRDPLPKRLIFIATSTGITPFRSMLPNLQEAIANHNIQIVILFGARTHKDILFYDEFLEFAKKNSNNFTYKACLSRVNLADLTNDYETTGYVQQQINALNIDPSNDLVYLCGNPKMIDETFAMLQELGMETSQIIREKYIS